MRTAACIIPAIAVLCCSERASAQADFDISRQDVTVDITDPASLSISIDATLTTMVEDVSYLLFATPIAPVSSITIDGAAVANHYAYPGMEYVYVVELDHSVPGGTQLELRVSLSGPPSCHGVTYDNCVYTQDEVVLTGSYWLLFNLTGNDSYTGSVQVRAPAEVEVVAGQGAATSKSDPDDGIRTWRFDNDFPANGSVFSAGRFETVRADSVIPIVGYFSGAEADRPTMQRIVDTAAEVLPEYFSMFGELPVDEFHILVVPGRFWWGGLGLLGNVSLQDFILDDRYAYLIQQGVAHEVAHSWWGNVAQPSVFAESLALGEGMAEYSAWLALGELHGSAVRRSGMRMNATWYMYARPDDEDFPLYSEDLLDSGVAVHVAYHKAPSVYRAIEQELGKDVFLNALSERLSESKEDPQAAPFRPTWFEDALAETKGAAEAATWIEPWFEETGFPRLSVSTLATDTAAGVDLTVDLQDRGHFYAAVPVRVTTSRSTALETVIELADGAGSGSLQLDSDALLIEVDPEWSFVREIQPALAGDVTFDGVVDGADLIEVALHVGGALPAERRVDGGYDPLYDLDEDRQVGAGDITRLLAAAEQE